MPVGAIVLTPGAPRVPVDLPTLDLSCDEFPESEWVARVAMAMRAGTVDVPAPLLLVFAAAASVHAPQLGFAQRAARRLVAHYVLVDPLLPPAGSTDWPDAPVTVIITPSADDDTRSQALAARLRGWTVREGEAASVIAEIAAQP